MLVQIHFRLRCLLSLQKENNFTKFIVHFELGFELVSSSTESDLVGAAL